MWFVPHLPDTEWKINCFFCLTLFLASLFNVWITFSNLNPCYTAAGFVNMFGSCRSFIWSFRDSLSYCLQLELTVLLFWIQRCLPGDGLEEHFVIHTVIYVLKLKYAVYTAIMGFYLQNNFFSTQLKFWYMKRLVMDTLLPFENQTQGSYESGKNSESLLM